MARALGLLGDEWTLLLVSALLSGATRYSELAGRMPISDAVLTARLDRLVAAEVVLRSPGSRTGYELTPRGRALWPLLVAIWAWELRWVPEHAHPTPPLVHQPCGHAMAPRFCCAGCGRPVRASALVTRWGPGGGLHQLVPDARTRLRRGAPDLYPDTMAVLGNRWSSAVVGAAFLGVRRFTDFQATLGAPPTLLAQRLAALCRHGILRRDEERAQYRLTEKGLDFFPAIAILVEWAQRWYGADAEPVLAWTHLECGAPLRGVLTCDQCGAALRGTDIDLREIGPSRDGSMSR